MSRSRTLAPIAEITKAGGWSTWHIRRWILSRSGAAAEVVSGEGVGTAAVPLVEAESAVEVVQEDMAGREEERAAGEGPVDTAEQEAGRAGEVAAESWATGRTERRRTLSPAH